MNCSRQKNIHGRQAVKRAVALALLLCFVFVVLLSGAFVASHAEHEHNRDGFDNSCTVCALLQSTLNLLKSIAVFIICALLMPVILFTAISRLFIILYYYRSPVKLNIRINC
jgi:uncharacterized PurR-regulated membrane protein YhhQ (DUF165 family)